MVTSTQINHWKERRLNASTLTKAVACGWGQQHALTYTELQILMFIAARGSHEFKNLSHSWRPKYGMDCWARNLGVSRRTLFSSLRSLGRKRLLVKHGGTPGHWGGAKAYGIPASVLEECASWNDGHLAVHHHRPSAILGTDPSAADGAESAVHDNSPVRGGASHSEGSGTPAPPLTSGNGLYYTSHEPKTQQATYVARRNSAGLPEPGPKVPNQNEELAEVQPTPQVIAEQLSRYFVEAGVASGVSLAYPWDYYESEFIAPLERLAESWSEDQLKACIDSYLELTANGELRPGPQPVPAVRLVREFKTCAAHAGLPWAEVLRWAYPNKAGEEIAELASTAWGRGSGPGSPSVYLPAPEDPLWGP